MSYRKGFGGRLFTYTTELAGRVEQCLNVYCTPDGTIHALPFNGGYGLYFFDGQIFYKLAPKERKVT